MLVGTARTEAGRALLREYLAGARTFEGEAVKQPTRWSIVERLIALGEPDPDALIAAETRARHHGGRGAARVHGGRGGAGGGRKGAVLRPLSGRSRG